MCQLTGNRDIVATANTELSRSWRRECCDTADHPKLWATARVSAAIVLAITSIFHSKQCTCCRAKYRRAFNYFRVKLSRDNNRAASKIFLVDSK